jgi:large subunit ribosomal protein L4
MEMEVYNIENKVVDKIHIPDSLPNMKMNIPLISEVVVAYLSNQRRGTACTKDRSEVSGGGRKPWPQKETGRARAGSIRSPLWRHGGVVFGPKPRSYRQNIPKKKRRIAFTMAIASKIKENKVKIVENLEFEKPNTKTALKVLQNLGLKPDDKDAKISVLVVPEKMDRKVLLSFRNICDANVIDVDTLCAYNVLKYDSLLFTKNAFLKLLKRLII